MHKKCHFFAEIVKFVLILTRLKLLFGQMGGENVLFLFLFSFGGDAHLWFCHCLKYVSPRHRLDISKPFIVLIFKIYVTLVQI